MFAALAPGLIVALAAVAVLVVLVALALFTAWQPRSLDRWRHATGEAGWRAGAAWSEFRDWVRIGR